MSGGWWSGVRTELYCIVTAERYNIISYDGGDFNAMGSQLTSPRRRHWTGHMAQNTVIDVQPCLMACLKCIRARWHEWDTTVPTRTAMQQSPLRSIPSVWGRENDAPLHSPRRGSATPPAHGTRITRQPAPVTAPAELGPGAQCSLLASRAALRLSWDSKQSKHIVVRYTCFAWSSAAGLERGRLG